MAPEADTHIEIKTSRSPHSKGGNKGGSLPLYRKLLLAATMTGNETCVSFQQLYEVPLLQILGVPVALISLYPIVTGPVAMVMLAVLGYCSDKGSNHRQKKVGVVVFNTILTLCGVSLVIMANVMLLTSEGNTDDPVSLADKNVTFGPLENITVASSLITLPATTTIPTANMTSAEPLQTEAEEPGLFSLPTTAVLGVLGFCLMDVGYDANIGSTRSCMLACSPAADHTSIFVLALVMAAVGGCINCGLGLVDLSHALDFGSGEGSLVVQTTVQLMVAFLLLVTCLTTTVINAFINIRNLNNDPQFQPLRNDDDDAVAKEEKSYGTFDTDWKQESDIDDQNSSYVTSDESILPPLPSEMESSIAVNTSDVTSKGGNSSTARPSRNFFRDNELVRSSNFTDLFVTEEQGPSRISSSQVSTTDKNPLLQELYRSTESTISYLSREQGGGPSFITRPAPPQKPVLTDSGKWCGVNKHKFNLILAACIAYLGASVLFSYNMYVSDFLGKVVNGGDSSAPEGSAERKAYEEGVSSAAGGLLVYNCSYMVSGAVQSKLLGFLGLKVDFCLAQALMGGAVLAMVLSEQLPVFYVACVLYGFQRSALYTVPFIIAEHYIEEKGLGKKGDSAVGRVMGAVSCMIPFNFCTVFLLSGPLISLTSYESAPLVVASVAAFLASLIFTLYRQG